jgi:hypothetical protein
MKHIVALSLAVTIAAISVPAIAQTASSSATPSEQCAIGYVSGIGGAPRSLREYEASDSKYRYLSENPLQCKISDEGRTSDCVGVVSLRNERVSVYDDSGDTLMSVVARVELDQGTYPVIIVVRKQDVKCEE